MMVGSPFEWSHPSTWPWIVNVWLAFVVVGAVRPAWRWIQKGRGESWPPADGRINSAWISKPTFSLTTRQGHYLAEILYSYSALGIVHSGRFTRDLPTEYDAEEFIRDVEGKTVIVHYDPDRPSRSVLREPDIDFLLNIRSPAPPPRLGQTPEIPSAIRPFLPLLIGISLLGLVISLWVHLGAVMGRQVAPEPFFWILHAGIFVVWFPAVLVATKLVGTTNRRDFWKAVLKGSPPWIRYMLYALLAYAVINFLFFMPQFSSKQNGPNSPAAVWRIFSGHWMAFYAAASAILYSALRSNRRNNRSKSAPL
jgi:hypothetical protein